MRRPSGETRFSQLQRKAQDTAQASWQHTLTLQVKFGTGNARYASAAERKRGEILDRAAGRAFDRFFAELSKISPRDWSAGVPTHWLRDKLTYADACTAGQLSVVPPPAWGASQADSERFARPVTVRVGIVGLEADHE